MESPVKTTAPKMSKAPVEKIIFIDTCRDCKKHRSTTWHDETKYEGNYNQVKAAIEALVPGVTVEKKIDETVNVGAFEILHKGKVLFSKKTSGLWPNAKAVAQRVQSYFEDLEQGNDTSHYGKQKERAYVPKKLSDGGRTFSGVSEFTTFSPKGSQIKQMSQTASDQKLRTSEQDTVKEDKGEDKPVKIIEPAQEEKKELVIEKEQPKVVVPHVEEVAAPKKTEAQQASEPEAPSQQPAESQQDTQKQEQQNNADQEAEQREILKKQQEDQEAERIKQEQLKEAEQKEKDRQEAEKREAEQKQKDEKEKAEKEEQERKAKEEADAAAAAELAKKDQEQKTENKPASEQASPAPVQEAKEEKASDGDEYNEEKFEETEDKPVVVEKKQTGEEEYSQDFNS